MSGRISKQDKIGNIFSRSEFDGFSKFIIPAPSGFLGMLMRQVKLAAVRRLAKTWNVDDIVERVNHVVSLVLSELVQRTVIYSVESK